VASFTGEVHLLAVDPRDARARQEADVGMRRGGLA
jgi:hypothetical protein